MIDTNCRLPAPSAVAWRIELEPGGPDYVVLRFEDRDAREALIEHLVEIGCRHRDEIEEMVMSAEITSIGVTW